MSSIMVDSNVLLDVATDDRRWGPWSAEALERAASESILVINPIIYAEVSIGFTEIETLELALPRALIRREALPWEAGFLAGKAFLRYRRRGGARSTPLPDFYIGAHAAVSGHGLLTRDPKRYATYFPSVRVIAPEHRETSG